MTTESYKKKGYLALQLYATRKNQVCNLTFAEYLDLVSKPCHLCGEPSTERSRSKIYSKAYGVGYLSGQCLPMCNFCIHNFAPSGQPVTLLLEKFKQIALAQGWIVKAAPKEV